MKELCSSVLMVMVIVMISWAISVTVLMAKEIGIVVGNAIVDIVSPITEWIDNCITNIYLRFQNKE